MLKWFFKFSAVVCAAVMSLDAKNCKFDLGAGYRQDQFEWELAGPDNMPKVMSRLTWKNLQIFEMEAQFRKITCQNIYLRFNGDYGWIFDGHNRDSDYRVNGNTGQTVEYLRSDNDGGKGNVYDAEAAIGYFIKWCMGAQKFRFAPLVGYSVHGQHLHLCNGYSSINIDNPIFEGHHFKGLDSSYKTCWYGPWTGLDFYYHLNTQITLTASFEYHWLHYHANGDWNLREDILGDFKHSGFGHGYFASLGIDYNFCSGWYLGALFKYKFANVNDGRDKTTIGLPINQGVNADNDQNSGSLIPYETTGKLRKIQWTSFSVIFTAGYNF